MQSLFGFINCELVWMRTSIGGLELFASENPEHIAELNVKGVFASQAEGKSADGSWIFKRAGMLKNGVSVQDWNGKKEIALFKKKGLGGTLEFKNGKRVDVARDAFMTEYSLSMEKDLLLTYKNTREKTCLVILSTAAELSEMPVLVLFLSYLVIMQRMDANFSAPF